MKRIPLLLIFLLGTALSVAQAADESLVVFLVRHAEKLVTGSDPDLAPAGEVRARALAHALRTSGITQVHSSDYKRTRNTADPVSRKLGLKTELYDPRDLPALVAQLKTAGGRHLVVGHSNTTPALAKLLGGEPGAAIEEKTEFDRLYVITIGENGAVSTVLLRYGLPTGK